MNPSNVVFSFLLSLTATASAVAIESPSRSSPCHPGQRDALSRFNQSFSLSEPHLINRKDFCEGTSYPKTSTWRTDEDCCSWEGVTCDNSTGDVVGLELSCAGLRGAINSSSTLFSLYHLRSLNLAGNYFRGIVPTEIAQLSKLVSLNLSHSGLQIQNPTMGMLVRNLTELEELDLSYTDMSVVTPPSLMNFSSSLKSLFLFNCSLGGKFPDYIFQLPNIRRVDLSENRLLSGTLPGFNSSSGFFSLALADCSFTGEVPRSIGNLSGLTYLDISGNNFNGQLDLATFSTLESLRLLGISRLSVSDEDASDAKPKFPKLAVLVIFEGNLKNFPCFLSSMPELTQLHLERSIVSEFPGECINNGLSFPQLQTLAVKFCNLTKFPSSLSHSKQLRILDLRGNMIEEAEIPGWFAGIGINTLEILFLPDNLLKGGLRLPWKSLVFLDLRNNSFEGALPIPVAPSIRAFRAEQNHFNGSISSSLCQLTHLQFLGLGQNILTGVIPQCLGNLTDLQFLDLSNNSLSGELPLPPHATNYYSVSKNNITGEIPSLMCNATNLKLLDLSNNGLTGSLPRCLKNITKRLLYLNLQVNKFHGLIPEIFPEGSRLSSLDFSMNQFDGPLPRSLSNCQRLEVLKVDDNKIVDSFPNWLGALPLRILSLRSNELHGPVSVFDANHSFSRIRILDLSNNSFEGNLPDNLFNQLSDMMLGDYFSGGNGYKAGRNAGGYMVSSFSSFLTAGRYEQFFSVKIYLKGVEKEIEKINAQLVMLHLSSNRFYGEIPKSIGSLKALKSLNFCHNSFTGTIPPSLGDLTNLETLDLSSNNLVGEIPRELVKLTSLEDLNLSWNNLVGHIPSGGHFNTFPNSSFEGNPGLCGITLEIACSQGSAEAQPPLDDGEDKAGGWFVWEFVVMGFGSGMGIGITLGYMALETGRPLWLARMVVRPEALCRKKRKRKAPRRNDRR